MVWVFFPNDLDLCLEILGRDLGYYLSFTQRFLFLFIFFDSLVKGDKIWSVSCYYMII